jgi:hypothetical protein
LKLVLVSKEVWWCGVVWCGGVRRLSVMNEQKRVGTLGSSVVVLIQAGKG